MALGRVMLLPGDDLSLCAVLKSPLFGFHEEDDLLHACSPEIKKSRASLTSIWLNWPHPVTRAGKWSAAHDELTSAHGKWPTACRCSSFYSLVLGRDGGRAKFLARLGSEASDVLDEFLSFALEHEAGSIPGLQAFLTTLEMRSPEIKRELEQGRDEVRIMTVHASKGLEAPVVFLVDSGGKPAETTSTYPNCRNCRSKRPSALCRPHLCGCRANRSPMRPAMVSEPAFWRPRKTSTGGCSMSA